MSDEGVGGVSLASELHAEIRRLRLRVPGVTGSLVATMDGLLIAQDVSRIEPEGVAALAAANIGLGQRVAASLGYGDLRDTLIRGTTGFVAVHAAGSRALLAVLAGAQTNAARLALETGLIAERVAAIIEVTDVAELVPGAARDGGTAREAGEPPAGPRSADLPRRRPAP